MPVTGCLLVLVAGTTPSALGAGPSLSISDGFDFFNTDPAGTSLGVAGFPLMHFAGVLIDSFDFGGSIGVQTLADTDTIVHHTAASEASPVSQLHLRKLQLQGVEDPTLFVTLQDDRGRNALDPPNGPPSLGSMLLSFDADGLGGKMSSLINVNFDVRTGSIDGLIVTSGSLALTTHDTGWSHDAGDAGCSAHEEGVVMGGHKACPSDDDIGQDFYLVGAPYCRNATAANPVFIQTACTHHTYGLCGPWASAWDPITMTSVNSCVPLAPVGAVDN